MNLNSENKTGESIMNTTTISTPEHQAEMNQSATESNDSNLNATTVQGDSEMQNAVATKESEKNMNIENEIAQMEEDIRKAEEDFRTDMQITAFEICQKVLVRKYGYDFTNAITKASGEAEQLTDKLYQEYMKSDEYDPEDPTPRSIFRKNVIKRGFHLYIADKYMCDDTPTEYSGLCDAIREASYEYEELNCCDADFHLKFPDIYSLVAFLENKEYEGNSTTYDGDTQYEVSVVVAHLLQIGMFCDIMEALPQHLFSVLPVDDE